MFIHLRVHSAYSLAEGAIHLKSVSKLALDHKMPAVAVTDTHNLFGAMEFSITASKMGIKPIIGCQIKLQLYDDTPAMPFVVLVKDHQGYLNLSHLLTKSYIGGGDCIISSRDLFDYNDGLIAFTGGQFGPLAHLMQKRDERALLSLQHMKDVFGDRLYMELMRHNDPHRLEPVFLQWALSEDIPLVATNDVYFENPNMFEAHDALLCIAEGRYISEADRRKVTPYHYFKSCKEMTDLFHDLPEAIENTVWIAKRCNYRLCEQDPILPHYPTNFDSEDDELIFQANQGLKERLRDIEPSQHKIYEERLTFEIKVISGMKFSGYFLIVSDFIKWAKKHNIPVGPGRGSGAGSIVAWALTITDIDPVRFGLIFERFLNPERVSMPDFDIDFCQDKRDQVIHYVRERYGADRVAHIITFGKLQARAALRDVGRVLQMPYNQVDRICKLVPNNPSHPVTLAQALEMEPLLKEQKENDETVSKLIDIAQNLEGLYRHASTHAAGVVISDKPLEQITPLYKDADSELPATQFSMKYVEMAGLVKFDFLGLKTLTVIEAAVDLIRKSHKPDFNISHIPLDDEKTFQLLTEVKTVGIFQLESGGMRDILKKLRPDRFEDLIALVSLYRPGPMDDIPKYLARKHGKEPIIYLHPSLEEVLKPTYGVMVYQEQVMKIAQILGGYSLGEADLLRRAMGKKIVSEMQDQRGRFIAGALEKGVSEAIAFELFEQMAKFSGYGFNKSHATPYAMLSYQTAYLKANYPKEFFAATMTHDMHNIDKLISYMQDMKKMDIKILPPDINASYSYFSVEGDGVRYGLSAIKNVGVASIDLVTADRAQRGKFKNLNDFARRVDSKALNKRLMENLIYSGSFDGVEKNRRFLADSLEGVLSQKHQIQQATLFSGVSVKKAPDWPLLERLGREFEALGFYMSAHPLDMYKKIIDTLKITKSSDLLECEETNVELVGILLTKQEKTSKTSGNKFAILTFSDLSGTFEMTLFSQSYQDAKELLIPGTALYIKAWLKRDGESLRISGQSLSKLEEPRQCNVTVERECDLNALLAALKTLPDGNAQFILSVNIQGHEVEMIFKKTFDFAACQSIKDAFEKK
jgi:DNA polymerase-3 subunit alpha